MLANKLARVRFSPLATPLASTTLGSSRTNRRKVWALPSNPPASAAHSESAHSPLCPKGGWPISWAKQAVSTTSASTPTRLASSRPIWATSREWVSRFLAKSSPAVGERTWVLAARRRSADECNSRPRSLAKSLRLEEWLSGTKRSVSDALYALATAGVQLREVQR